MNPALWAPSVPNWTFPCRVRSFVVRTNCSRRRPVRRASARLKCRIHSVLENTHSRAQHAAPLPTNEPGIARTSCKLQQHRSLLRKSASNSPRAEQLPFFRMHRWHGLVVKTTGSRMPGLPSGKPSDLDEIYPLGARGHCPSPRILFRYSHTSMYAGSGFHSSICIGRVMAHQYCSSFSVQSTSGM